MRCFLAQVELAYHELSELFHFLWQRDPSHPGQRIKEAGKELHDLDIMADDAMDIWMQDFDGNSCAMLVC